MIFALDVTTERGSLALADAGGRLVDLMEVEAPEGFGSVLFDAVGRILKRNGVGLGEVGLFAAASGPGTFTGVRIGLTCAKGLAEAMGRGLVAVSNLEAVARFGQGERRGVTLDARRGEVYAAIYGADGAVAMAEHITTLERFREEEMELVEYRGALAGAIAEIAAGRRGGDPALVEANYIRRSDAELNLGRY